MSKAVRAGVVVVVAVLAACSSGGKQAEAPTTTSTVPPTTQVTSTTLSQEEQVKAAYLAYWQMADRLGSRPDPSDPELAHRTAEPLLSNVRDGLTTQAAQGKSFVPTPNRPNDHQVDGVLVKGTSASLHDCFIDGRSEVDSAGVVIDDAIVSKDGVASLTYETGVWKIADVRFDKRTPGVGGCAN